PSPLTSISALRTTERAESEFGTAVGGEREPRTTIPCGEGGALDRAIDQVVPGRLEIRPADAGAGAFLVRASEGSDRAIEIPVHREPARAAFAHAIERPVCPNPALGVSAALRADRTLSLRCDTARGVV